jgi:tRNA threonylcarbamoyladenosine biosynthesis protein TsaB
MRNSTPLLLALDTSTRTIGLALYNGVQVVSESVWTSHDHHTVELAPAIADMLAKSNLQVTDLHALAVALGPGSFTGLRIGLALAKGLALVRKLPIVGIPTLDALAASQPVLPVPLAAILQAGRGRLAVGWYQANQPVEPTPSSDEDQPAHEAPSWQAARPVEVLTPAELSQRIHSPTLVCGELSEEERRLLGRKRKNVILASPAGSLRRPAFLAELGWRRWQAGAVDDPATLAPVYLHYNNRSQSAPIPE